MDAAAPGFVSHQVTRATRFYLNLTPARTRGLVVVCGGVERCAADYVVRRRTFPFLCVEFVADGEGEVTLQGANHPLRAGSVFCYGPSVAHEIRTHAAAPMEKYFLDFAGGQAISLLRQCGLAPGRTLEVQALGDVRSEFDALIRLGLRQDDRTARTCALQLELLLHTIARSGGTRTHAERRARAAFERCRHFIDVNFLQLRSLADVAAACQMDDSHVCRLFRRFHRESPLQYLQRRRMHWAADRLQTSGVLVREVADELALDPFHFSRIFKRVHGLSPLGFLNHRATQNSAAAGTRGETRT
jgi:AraC-like DNA-binding protein